MTIEKKKRNEGNKRMSGEKKEVYVKGKNWKE